MEMDAEKTIQGGFDEPYPFGKLESPSGETIALKSAAIKGVIEGLLFSSAIVQKYVNATGKNLEVIYTFPVGWGTVLLGLEASIGGRSLKGMIVEKYQAEDRYEEALENGDTAIMLQQSARGLYTANLGNIQPGEEVEISIHCARLLAYDQGRIRLCIPTVIGERYGDPHGPGALAPHESARSDANARYGFSLRLDLLGEIAKAEIVCPSHQIQTETIPGGVRVDLERGAMLDRDFILLLQGLPGSSQALCAADGSQWLAAAGFCPKMPEMATSPLGLKILVDCSGSMAGESIAEAKKGLRKVLTLLGGEDCVSFSRFGSGVWHAADALLPCSPANIQNLTQQIEKTDANMGGTEMKEALLSTFAIRQDKQRPPAVLLITDGDVWDADGILAQARKSGHRIFAIGVGYAPAESLLRDLAEQSGGACEFVSPRENIAEAITRMFHRMRGKTAKNIRIDWGEETVWQSAAPKYIYDGETVHAFAIFDSRPEKGPVLAWEISGQSYEDRCAGMEETASRDLTRLGRMWQLEETEADREKLALALKYKLISDLTSAILVYERAGDEKMKNPPRIQQVPQMPAHGHGAGLCAMQYMTSSFCAAPRLGKMLQNILPPTPFPQNDAPDVSRWREVVGRLWQEKVLQCADMREFMAEAMKLPELRGLAARLAKLAAKMGIAEEAVWAAFAAWSADNLDRHGRRLLRSAGLEDGQRRKLEKKFNAWLKPGWGIFPPVIF